MIIGRKGFTLIEILIVVAIIAILASVVIVGLGPTQQAGRDARRLADLHEIQNAIELYYNKCGFYPGGAVSGAACATALPAADAFPAGNAQTSVYGAVAKEIIGAALGVNNMPQDPASGKSYMYRVNPAASPTTYIIAANLESSGNASFTNYNPATAGNYLGGDTTLLTSCNAPTFCLTL